MHFEVTIRINRPVDEVFAFVMDPTNDPKWRYGLVEGGFSTTGDVGVGSRGFAVAGEGDRAQRVDWELVTYEPEREVAWNFLNGPLGGGGGYRFARAEDGGTDFTLIADLKLRGLTVLLWPVFRWVGGRRNRGDLEKLKDILESHAAAR